MPVRVLIVDDGLAHLETSLSRAAEQLAGELEARDVEVVRALSYEDSAAVLMADAALSGVLVNWDLGADDVGNVRSDLLGGVIQLVNGVPDVAHDRLLLHRARHLHEDVILRFGLAHALILDDLPRIAC